MQTKTQNQKKPVTYTNDNILETVRGLGGSVTKSTVDAGAGVVSDVLTSLLGSKPKAGEMRQNEAVQLSAEKPTAPRVALRPEFVRPQPVRTEDIALKQQIAAVRAELKALAASIKSFQSEVQKAVNEQPVEPGVYHVNFFARLKSLLKLLREQIDDSRSWLALSTGRKKKMGYWGMLKKHGTTFGMSSERSIATQAG